MSVQMEMLTERIEMLRGAVAEAKRLGRPTEELEAELAEAVTALNEGAAALGRRKVLRD